MINEHTILLNEFQKYSLLQQLLRLIASLPSNLPSNPLPSLLLPLDPFPLPLEVSPLNTAEM